MILIFKNTLLNFKQRKEKQTTGIKNMESFVIGLVTNALVLVFHFHLLFFYDWNPDFKNCFLRIR